MATIAAALAPVSAQVAALLAPTRSVARIGAYGYEGNIEQWKPRPVDPSAVPDLQRQLCLIESALAPGDIGFILARIHALLAHYRHHDLPPEVERALAADWADDVGAFPALVVEEACRRWRRDTARYRFKPLPGDIRAICLEILGSAPTTAQRLRRLLAQGVGAGAG